MHNTVAGAMVLFLLLAAAQAQDGNLIVNPGLESEPAFDWRPAGEKTVAQRVQTRPHTGAWCLYVRDDGNQWGQGNNARFAAAPGLYYAEAWVRVDFVRSPVYTFADGRGAPTDFGDLKAANAVVI
ncbi:MAG: hypothetical protein FJ279_17950, partial [Planctomycetes bacterium]|nr:hypothetical protein [Planctomycetota bacterium]